MAGFRVCQPSRALDASQPFDIGSISNPNTACQKRKENLGHILALGNSPGTSRPTLVRRLAPSMIAVALGAVTIIGSGALMCAVGREESMDSGNGTPAVQVTTDKSSYHLGEPIVVTVVNGLSVSIFALNGQTYCTIVTVQRTVDGQWTAEGRCLALGPPGWLEIVAGGRTPVEVKPRLPSDRPLATGRHRVMLTFTIGSSSGSPAIVFSSEFLISDRGRLPAMTALT